MDFNRIKIIYPLPIDEDTMTILMKFLFSRKKSVESLLCILCYHPSLVFSIIYAANMPEFGFSGKIVNLTTAITLLTPQKVIDILSNNKIILFNNKKINSKYYEIIHFSKKYTNPLYDKKKNRVYLNALEEFNNVAIHLIGGIYIQILLNYKDNYFTLTKENKLEIFTHIISFFNFSEETKKELKKMFNLFSKNNI